MEQEKKRLLMGTGEEGAVEWNRRASGLRFRFCLCMYLGSDCDMKLAHFFSFVSQASGSIYGARRFFLVGRGA